MTIFTRDAAVRQLWLNYFNRSLRDRNIITLEEYRKLASRICKNS